LERMMLEIGSAIDRGIKRRDRENQDALLVVQPGLLNHKPPLLVVADGMGGYSGGALASRIVIHAMQSVYQKAARGEQYLGVLSRAVLAAHHEIKQKAAQDPSLAQMGSTVVAVILDAGQLYLANVGDSRAYLISKRRIEQINWDHSLMADLIRAHQLSPEQAETFSRKNILTLSLSARQEEVKPFLLARQLEPDEHVLLCSDGLWGSVNEREIQRAVLRSSAQEAAAALVGLANANQGPDNISVIVAKQSGRTLRK